MKIIFTAIKIIIISILSVFYYPLNTSFLFLQKHYRAWKTDDRISYIIATPLYYFLFIVTAILSLPLEIMGDAFHPSLGGFR